jgi:hypothetical protein
MVDEFTTLTLVAATPAKVTVAPERKLLPLIVTGVPPAVLPLCGLTELTVGAGFVGVGVGVGLGSV